MIRHNDNVIPFPTGNRDALAQAMDRHPAGSGIMHFDADAAVIWDRRYAGNVKCGKNAGRRNRTDDERRVTCKECAR